MRMCNVPTASIMLAVGITTVVLSSCAATAQRLPSASLKALADVYTEPEMPESLRQFARGTLGVSVCLPVQIQLGEMGRVDKMFVGRLTGLGPTVDTVSEAILLDCEAAIRAVSTSWNFATLVKNNAADDHSRTDVFVIICFEIGQMATTFDVAAYETVVPR
jgi:hypothetical protein